MYFEICQDLYYKNFAIVYLGGAMSWYAKMYFSGDREIFQYDSMGTQGAPSVHQELPFLESLLSFQELDIAEQTPLLKDIADCWGKYIADDDKDALTSAMMKLGELGVRHIYFQLLHVRFYERMPHRRCSQRCRSRPQTRRPGTLQLSVLSVFSYYSPYHCYFVLIYSAFNNNSVNHFVKCFVRRFVRRPPNRRQSCAPRR